LNILDHVAQITVSHGSATLL